MDGTSGALYTIFLNSLLQRVKQQHTEEAFALTPKQWAEALTFAMSCLSTYTPAKVGDRTMIDSLVPFIDSYSQTFDLGLAVRAARDGAERTKNMKASLGRSVYIATDGEWIGTVPDPGAYALSKFFSGLVGVGL